MRALRNVNRVDLIQEGALNDGSHSPADCAFPANVRQCAASGRKPRAGICSHLRRRHRRRGRFRLGVGGRAQAGDAERHLDSAPPPGASAAPLRTVAIAEGPRRLIERPGTWEAKEPKAQANLSMAIMDGEVGDAVRLPHHNFHLHDRFVFN
jgi:hypothetical protein